MRQLPLVIHNSDLSLSSSVDNHVSSPATPCTDAAHTGSGISEIILSTDSALQPIYLLPILSQMALDKRWLMWIADEPCINRQWVSALGIDASQVLHIKSEQRCLQEICSKALAAGTGHLIIEWPGKISDDALEELEAAAKKGNSHALLIRRR